MAALFMGGMFNEVDPVIGLPFYVWEWILSIIIIIITWICLYLVWWKPYAPLHGIYWAWKNGSGAAFILDKYLIAELVAEQKAKCIFDYGAKEYNLDIPDSPLYHLPLIGGRILAISGWFHKKVFYYPTLYLPNLSKFEAFRYKVGHVNKDVEIAAALQNGEWERYPSVICGGVPVDIIVDTDNWTIPTSPQHKAIVPSASEWNKNNPYDQVHSYMKYQRYILPGPNGEDPKIIAPKEIKTTALIPWTRIETCFPMNLEESDWAGKRRQMAIDAQRDRDGANRWQMALIIIGAGALIGILEIVAKVIGLAFS